jgi:hypothetical protein
MLETILGVCFEGAAFLVCLIFKDNQTGNKSFRAEINQHRLTHNRRGNEPFQHLGVPALQLADSDN